MKTWIGWIVALMVWAVVPAWAQTAATLGTTSAKVLSAQPRSALQICNESATATVTICFGANGASCTATANTAGQYTIASGQCLQWSDPLIPPGGEVDGIASAANTPITALQVNK